MAKKELNTKRIRRASWRERLYFLLSGRIPNYAMRANNDVAAAWLNILRDPECKIGYYKNMSDEKRKIITHFLATSRISNRKEQVEAFKRYFDRKYVGDWNERGGGDFCPPDYL